MLEARFEAMALAYEELARRHDAECARIMSEMGEARLRGEGNWDGPFNEWSLDFMAMTLAAGIDEVCAYFARKGYILSDEVIEIEVRQFREKLGSVLLPHERGERDEILDLVMREIDDRALIISWSGPAIDAEDGSFIPRVEGTAEAIAPVRAGRRDEGIALMLALLERQGATRH
jgi:hypothetical protein